MTEPNEAGRASPSPHRRASRRFWIPAAVVVALAVAGGAFVLAYPERTPEPLASFAAGLTGANPHPIRLIRPTDAPLSALAQLGRKIFYDPSLSASGRQSCASCHSPDHAYGPPNALSVQIGGPHMTLQGVRPPPSLAYLYRQQPFSIGPDVADADVQPTLSQVADQAKGTARAAKVAGQAPAAPAVVPQGGLFWDGRSATLQMQATGPMLDPAEMANASQDEVAAKLLKAPYARDFVPLFGPQVLKSPAFLASEAMSAVGRYQIEEASFHPFDSKYDAWLEGHARLSAAERRGLKLFNDQDKANCAGCHISAPGKDGLPPLFSDSQYEALGAPRNMALPANRDPNHYDLGLCGPYRTDLAAQTQYCGMFLTPTLRNSARRQVFFHNGVYHTLEQVLAFYDFRDVQPERVYPKGADGKVRRFDDLPQKYWANVDRTDAPLNRKPGEAPAMSDADMKDIIAFLHTLDDGYGRGGGSGYRR